MRFSKSKFLSANADLSFMSLAEQIYSDYVDTIKLAVVPKIDKTHALKLREVRVLMSLSEATTDVSASELADQLRHDPSTITRSLVILVRGDFIKTYENQSDGRSKMIGLTEKGADVANFCHKTLDAFLSKVDSVHGLEDSQTPDELYVERMIDIGKRAAFVLEKAKQL